VISVFGLVFFFCVSGVLAVQVIFATFMGWFCCRGLLMSVPVFFWVLRYRCSLVFGYVGLVLGWARFHLFCWALAVGVLSLVWWCPIVEEFYVNLFVRKGS